MLQTVIIMTGAGVVIFEKVWESTSKLSDKGRLFGQLITTMQEFSRQSTGMVVSYMELGEVAMSIVDDVRTKLICTLFHDLQDGPDFGKLIANEILRTFMEKFADVSFSGTLNVTTFSGFSTRLLEAIHNSVRAIAQQLQLARGVTNALVIYDDGTAIIHNHEEDQLGVVANLQPLITFSTDIMQAKKDKPKVITLEMSNRIVFVHRVGGEASLVTVCRKSTKPAGYRSAIDLAVSMLDRVFILTRALS